LQAVYYTPAIRVGIPFVSVFFLFVIAAFLSAGERVLYLIQPDEINAPKEERSIHGRLIRKLLKNPQQTRNTGFIIRIVLYITIFVLGIYGIRSLLFRSVDSVLPYFLVAAGFFVLFYLFDVLLPAYIVRSYLTGMGQNTSTVAKDPNGQEMIEEIQDFYHKTADEIMVPRLDMTAIDLKYEWMEVLDAFIQTGYSRIPVYEETEDNIKGILYVKDLLPSIKNPQLIQWRKLIRPAYFVPETKKIDDLLEEFRTNKIHLAIVVDEFGCTSGLVTLEDIIEEIVGEISDEYDSDEKQFLLLKDGSYIFKGKIQLIDFFRETDIDEDEFGKLTEEVDTLAGLLLKIKGTLPRRKEVIDFKPYRFRILEADERRVLKVKFSCKKEM
jgi:CBS domain containing-hemolysin-like protein